jgi:enoyl-CoA hydratase/carnithine racemase
MEFREILYEKKDWVARITINRPKVYNAYNLRALQEICEALHQVLWDGEVAVAVITGAGDKAFCTGGDANEYATVYPRKPHGFYQWWEFYERMLYLIRTCGKPVIARINGVVAGGGNEINLACDLSIAAEHARFVQPGTRVGSVSAGGATQWLPLTIGEKRTRWMVLVGDEVDARTAEAWGLVNKVVPYERLDEEVDLLCEKLIHKMPDSLRYTKVQLNFWGDLAWNTFGHARDWLSLHYATAEPLEGFRAFLEKRPADFLKLRRLAAEGKAYEYQWGAPVRECGNCGERFLPEDFDFCGKCGVRLGAD